MKFLVVDLETLNITCQYDADEALPGNPLVSHIELPEGIPSEFAKAELDGEDVVIILDEERALENLRIRRNMKLAACDYTQLPDCPLSVEAKASWAAYRQELRDLTEDLEDVLNPIWPEEP